ncbi:hypothetical protein LY76DRAFT_591606 [Colletotrichum caudatum]|nr:hypothetical protein LY76DRAFT_591606 [Colletotrichum caudatum]
MFQQPPAENTFGRTRAIRQNLTGSRQKVIRQRLESPESSLLQEKEEEKASMGVECVASLHGRFIQQPVVSSSSIARIDRASVSAPFFGVLFLNSHRSGILSVCVDVRTLACHVSSSTA